MNIESVCVCGGGGGGGLTCALRENEGFYLKTHSPYFNNGYMASEIW